MAQGELTGQHTWPGSATRDGGDGMMTGVPIAFLQITLRTVTLSVTFQMRGSN